MTQDDRTASGGKQLNILNGDLCLQ